MKKIYILWLTFLPWASQAQDVALSIDAGFSSRNTSSKVNILGQTEKSTVSDSGFFVGISTEVTLSDTWGFQPGLFYSAFDGTDFLQLPILSKCYIAERVALTAGPQLTYALEDKFDIINNLGVDVSMGVSIDIIERWSLFVRYAIELTNRTPDAIEVNDFDGFNVIPVTAEVETHFNTWQIGLGYKL